MHRSSLVNVLTLFTTHCNWVIVLRQSSLLSSSMLVSNQINSTLCTIFALFRRRDLVPLGATAVDSVFAVVLDLPVAFDS